MQQVVRIAVQEHLQSIRFLPVIFPETIRFAKIKQHPLLPRVEFLMYGQVPEVLRHLLQALEV